MPRAEIVLPLTIVAAAVALGVSEFMVIFEFTPPGGEPLRESVAADRHGYAMLLLAVFTVAAMLFAIATGVRAAAFATAGLGIAALLLFLLLDLPDAGKLGDLEDPIRGLANARAEPQEGFWLTAVGSIVLGLAAGAFATLTPEQLSAPAQRFGRTDQRSESGREPFDADAEAEADAEDRSGRLNALRRLRRDGR